RRGAGRGPGRPRRWTRTPTGGCPFSPTASCSTRGRGDEDARVAGRPPSPGGDLGRGGRELLLLLRARRGGRAVPVRRSERRGGDRADRDARPHGSHLALLPAGRASGPALRVP